MDKQVFETYDGFNEDFWYIFARRDLLLKLFKKHSSNKNGMILDLGCGPGLNNKVLKKYGTVTSIDYLWQPIVSCKKKRISNLVQGDAQALPFKDDTYDTIIAIELLEHLDDDKLALQEIRRVLRPGGILICTVPAHKWLWSTDDLLAHHKRRYSRKGFLAMGQRFHIKFFGHRYFFLFFPAMVIFLYQRLLHKVNKKPNSLSLTPGFMNRFLRFVSGIENTLLASNVRFPSGIGWLGVLKK